MEPEIVDVDLGKAIKEGLKKNKMSRTELGKIMNVSSSLASAWANNLRVPTGKDVIKIAKILDIVEILFPGYVKDREQTNRQIADIIKEIEALRQADRQMAEKIQMIEQKL